MQIPYPANIYTKDALSSAIKELERTIEHCGSLCHKDSKQSDSAKEYFASQEKEAKETIKKLQELIRGIHE